MRSKHFCTFKAKIGPYLSPLDDASETEFMNTWIQIRAIHSNDQIETNGTRDCWLINFRTDFSFNTRKFSPVNQLRHLNTLCNYLRDTLPTSNDVLKNVVTGFLDICLMSFVSSIINDTQTS